MTDGEGREYHEQSGNKTEDILRGAAGEASPSESIGKFNDDFGNSYDDGADIINRCVG